MNSYYNFNYLKNTFFKNIKIYLMNTLLICWYIYLLVIRTFPEKPLHVCVCINAYFCAVVVLKRHFLRDRPQLGQETGIRVKVIRDNKSSYLQYFKDKSYGCYDRFSRNFIAWLIFFFTTFIFFLKVVLKFYKNCPLINAIRHLLTGSFLNKISYSLILQPYLIK